jgi:hypothetical protein
VDAHITQGRDTVVAVAEEHILGDPPALTTQTYERREGASATDHTAIAAELPGRKVYCWQQDELIKWYQVQLPAKRESFKVIGILAGHDFMKVRIHMAASFFRGERLQFRQAWARDYRGKNLPFSPWRHMARRHGSAATTGSHDDPDALLIVSSNACTHSLSVFHANRLVKQYRSFGLYAGSARCLRPNSTIMLG